MYKTEKEKSAGGVVFRAHQDGYQVILISRKNNTVWCLPKGKIELPEQPQDAALREVKEETGVEAGLVDFLGDVHYWYIDKKRELRLNKTVDFFLMEYKAGNIDKHDFEVDAVSWFEINVAIEKATYPSERKILEKARSFLLAIKKRK